MRRFVLCAVSLMLVVVLSGAALAVSTLTAKTAGTITIDGNTSDWNLAEFTTKTRGGQNQNGDTAWIGWDGGTCYYGGYWTGATLPTNAADHTAKVYCRVDSSYVYFLVRCDDQQMNYAQPTSANWANDCIEFYIDPSHNHGSSSMNNSTSDVQLVLDANNQKNVYMTTSGYATQVLGGVTSAVVRDATGWWLEARITKTALDPDIPASGGFGVDFCFRDNDNPDATYFYGHPSYSTAYSWSDNPTGASFPTKIPDRWGDLGVPAPSIRFNATFDGGTTVTVDNDSSWTNDWVAGLVIAADRSTQTDGQYYHSQKGLMKNGDRIYVNNNYMAWFDYTRGDGITFANPPYGNTWERSGALTGFWTLDSFSGYFKYWKTGPNGYWNWAHNELIPGSASPNQEQGWWDAHAPPTEHSFMVVSGASQYFLSYHYAKQTSNSQWAQVTDGVKDAAGMHYKTSARMTSWTYNVDIVDGNDGNGISNYVSAEVEYICRTNDIYCIWKFKPNNANVVVNNLFVFLWSAYAQDEDGTACDVYATGSQWPGTVYGQDMYNQSNLAMITNWNGSYYSPGSIAQMVLGPTCSSPYVNEDIYTTPAFAVGDGSYIRCGEASNLSINSPRWQYTNLGVPGSGAGTQANPYRFAFQMLDSWNETHDGTLGFGPMRGPYSNPADYVTLQSDVWYQAEFAVRTNF